MSVSQKDIAEKLDLSVATVSRCLSNDSRIPPETRVKVIAMAHKLGYQPKKAPTARPRNGYLNAGTISLGQPIALSVFVQDSATHGSSNTLQAIAGMSAAAQDLNASLALQFFSPENAKAIHLPQNQPDSMRAGTIQGVILLCNFDLDSVSKLSKQIPCISVQHHALPNIDYVGIDNIRTIDTIIKKLAKLGHRKIGFIDNKLIAAAYKQRLEGFILGKYNQDLDQSQNFVFPTWNHMIDDDTVDFSELHNWIKQGVSALVCANDAMAIKVYRWLTQNNYRCPEQISITGMDGEPMPPDMPQITTVKIPFHDIGRIAVKQLITRIKQPELKPIRITIQTDFVAGNTIAQHSNKQSTDLIR